MEKKYRLITETGSEERIYIEEVQNMEEYYITYNDYFGFCVVEKINGNGKIVFTGSIEDCNRKCIELNSQQQPKCSDLERQPRDGLPALMMADQKGNYMTVAERKINTEDLISFEEIAKKHIAGEYLAIGDNGKSYHASYVPEYEPSGVMFFCIPSDVEILGYLEIS